MKYLKTIGRWDVFEAVLRGPKDGNPFIDYHVYGIFSSKDENVQTEGFYDGNGIYRIRFMPSFEGTYSFIIRSTFENEVHTGSFRVVEPQKNNHGPVRVNNKYHFSYSDGNDYSPFGTTSYVWHLQSPNIKMDTLNSLVEAGFNKMRFCIFPKHYVYNLKNPNIFPYIGKPMDDANLNEDNFMEYSGKAEGNKFDYSTFNPEYFQILERNIYELGLRGIEADLILFHPYDRWGFSCMSNEEDKLYLNYVINRFASFHNVWWSLANEWDLLKNKTKEDWQEYGKLVKNKDCYNHLRSIHNCLKLYDHSEDWITHCSIQRIDLYKGAELTNEFIDMYKKPVIMDEIGYEGNIQYGWGNLQAEELVRRFYETTLRGGYPGHSETYLNDKNILWWSHGGVLHGESWKRINFLHEIIKDVPNQELCYFPLEWDSICAIPECDKNAEIKSQYLFYYSFMRPSFREFHFDDETDFAIDVIDTWNMTISPVGIQRGKIKIILPARPYMMIRLKKASEIDFEIQDDEKSNNKFTNELAAEEFENEDNNEVIIDGGEIDFDDYEESIETDESYLNNDAEESKDELIDDEEDFDIYDLAPLDDTFTNESPIVEDSLNDDLIKEEPKVKIKKNPLRIFPINKK